MEKFGPVWWAREGLRQAACSSTLVPNQPSWGKEDEYLTLITLIFCWFMSLSLALSSFHYCTDRLSPLPWWESRFLPAGITTTANTRASARAGAQTHFSRLALASAVAERTAGPVNQNETATQIIAIQWMRTSIREKSFQTRRLAGRTNCW